MPLRKSKSRSILDIPERERGQPGLETVAKLLRDADPKEHRLLFGVAECPVTDIHAPPNRNAIAACEHQLRLHRV